MILRQDFIHEMRININFSIKTMYCNDAEVDMKKFTCMMNRTFHTKEECFVSKTTDSITKSLDAKYDASNVKQLMGGFRKN